MKFNQYSTVLFISIFLLLSCSHDTVLMNQWPLKYGSHAINYNLSRVKNALIVLNNNKTLEGKVKFALIQLSGFTNVFAKHDIRIELLPKGKTLKNDVEGLFGWTISYIRVFPDDAAKKNIYADYYHYQFHNVNYYLRQYAQKDSLTIAVDDYYFSEDQNHFTNNFTMYLVSSQKIIKMGGTQKNLWIATTPEKIMLKFINKHFNQSFKTGYFKDGHKMADYILANGR